MALHRRPITWALYGVNGAWASFIYLSGPVAPVLSEDLGVAVGWAGLVGTGLAVGLATSAAVAPRVVMRMGRDRAVRAGMLVVAAALVAMLLVPLMLDGSAAFASVLALVWLAAVGGGTALNAATARLSATHPEHSAKVITEANAAAAWVGVLSPLLLGLALGAGLGWWAGIVVCLVAAALALVGLALAGRSGGPVDSGAGTLVVVADEAYEAPASASESAARPTTAVVHRPLPGGFRMVLVALFAAVATEFSISFWGSTLIAEQTGTPAARATSAMTALVAGIAVGRTIGSPLTPRVGPHRMLLGGFALALGGFAVLWSATGLGLAVTGLFLAGLGIAALFPLLLDRAIGASDGQPDLAMARASLVLGFAVGSAPFALGALGTVVDVRTALLLVPALVVAGLVAVVLSRPGVAASRR